MKENIFTIVITTITIGTIASIIIWGAILSKIERIFNEKIKQKTNEEKKKLSEHYNDLFPNIWNLLKFIKKI
jgi:hypothetical protein